MKKDFNVESTTKKINELKKYGEKTYSEMLSTLKGVLPNYNIWFPVLVEHHCIICLGKNRYTWKAEPIHVSMVQTMYDKVEAKVKQYAARKTSRRRSSKPKELKNSVQITPEYCEQFLLKLGYRVLKPRPIVYDEIKLSE